jgi:hypothetical protein
MFTFYKFDKKTLLWKKDSRKNLVFILLISVSLISSFLLGTFVKIKNIDDKISERVNKFQPPADPHTEYIDSLFKDYEKRAKFYLSQKKFKKTPIKPYMLATCAKDAYLSTGVFLPVELALAQAEIESSMGTKGRSHVTNPFNIGEWDSATKLTYKTTYDGIKAYYTYMTSSYLRCKPIDILFKNFTNCSGHRYASSQTYEKTIYKEYIRIENNIDNAIRKCKK